MRVGSQGCGLQNNYVLHQFCVKLFFQAGRTILPLISYIWYVTHKIQSPLHNDTSQTPLLIFSCHFFKRYQSKIFWALVYILRYHFRQGGDQKHYHHDYSRKFGTRIGKKADYVICARSPKDQDILGKIFLLPNLSCLHIRIIFFQEGHIQVVSLVNS